MADTTDFKIDIPEELYERVERRAARLSMTVEDYLREPIEKIATRPEPG